MLLANWGVGEEGIKALEHHGIVGSRGRRRHWARMNEPGEPVPMPSGSPAPASQKRKFARVVQRQHRVASTMPGSRTSPITGSSRAASRRIDVHAGSVDRDDEGTVGSSDLSAAARSMTVEYEELTAVPSSQYDLCLRSALKSTATDIDAESLLRRRLPDRL